MIKLSCLERASTFSHARGQVGVQHVFDGELEGAVASRDDCATFERDETASERAAEALASHFGLYHQGNI
jgi:hypothetical protein